MADEHAVFFSRDALSSMFSLISRLQKHVSLLQ